VTEARIHSPKMASDRTTLLASASARKCGQEYAVFTQITRPNGGLSSSRPPPPDGTELSGNCACSDKVCDNIDIGIFRWTNPSSLYPRLQKHVPGPQISNRGAVIPNREASTLQGSYIDPDEHFWFVQALAAIIHPHTAPRRCDGERVLLLRSYALGTKTMFPVWVTARLNA